MADVHQRLRIDNPHSFAAAIKGGIGLFLGAGFSVLASDRDGKHLPTGKQFKQELVDHLNLDGSQQTLTLPRLATVLTATRRNEFYNYIKRRFLVSNFSAKYRVLEQVNTDVIFSTNVDDLIYRIFESDISNKYLNDIKLHGPRFNDRNAIDYIPLHGSLRHPNPHFIFGATELAAAFALDPDAWRYLTRRLQTKPTLFWGYALDDADTLEALNPASTAGRDHREKWIQLLDPSDADCQYFRTLGFQIISGDTEDLLDYLAAILAEDKQERPHRVYVEIPEHAFPEYRIPKLQEVPVRPTTDFYQGAPPTWSDIFLGNLHKTRHFNTLLDAIRSGKHVNVVGIPASGKTTLMMQCAAVLDEPGLKFFADYIPKEKVARLAEAIGDKKAFVFLDNLADSVDAVNILLGNKNIQVIAGEREYNFDIVSHLLNKKNSNLIDVTEISDYDIQSLFDRIPQVYRRQILFTPPVEGDRQPSVFEFVEANVNLASLGSRFRDVLDELDRKDQVLGDTFIMCCYVHTCRVPVSFDLVLSFAGAYGLQLSDINGLLDRLGSLILDYSGAAVDTEQDHFVPRSTFVSEAVIHQTRPSALKRVLTNFFSEVSEYRIPRIDVFRRKAYDADVIGRAFPNWNEGKAFFEELLGRDRDPFKLQQGALYLSDRKQFKTAFAWIDEAVQRTGRRVPSIRNSHGVILFKANIDVPGEQAGVRANLDRAMEIVEHCYRYDKRKWYHAATFADMALKYFQRYGDQKASEYLDSAARWLKEEHLAAPWRRQIKRLMRVIERQA